MVYLQHGLLDSSATWVMNFPEQSLAFILHDAGYDVWLGRPSGGVLVWIVYVLQVIKEAIGILLT